MLTIGLILLLITIVTGVVGLFEFFLIGTILTFSGVLGVIFSSEIVAIVLALAMSAMYLLFGRKYFFQKLDIKTIKTNSEALVGKVGTVTREFKNLSGVAKIEGEEWRAESIDETNFAKGEKVKIEKIDSITLKVSKYKE